MREGVGWRGGVVRGGVKSGVLEVLLLFVFPCRFEGLFRGVRNEAA